MSLKPSILLLVAAGLLAFALPACAQTVPTYQGNLVHLSVGIGPSGYEPGWGQGRMYGGAVWADWSPQFLPRIFRGLGVEIEGRDISLDQHLPSEEKVRQDTLAGGPIYEWRRLQNFHPYGKFLIGYGSFGFSSTSPTYSHDTRTFLAPGGGFEYRIHSAIWARVDYEYQSVQTIIGAVHHPQGFTLGVAYNFGERRPTRP